MGSQNGLQREALASMDSAKEGKGTCVLVKWGEEPGDHQDTGSSGLGLEDIRCSTKAETGASTFKASDTEKDATKKRPVRL